MNNTFREFDAIPRHAYRKKEMHASDINSFDA